MDPSEVASPEDALCFRCGCSLAGLPPDAACPLCRFPAGGSSNVLPAVVPAQATCIRCAYSLAGLKPDGVCPECGTPIERSLRGDLLAYSDPLYVQKLFTGARLVLWPTVGLILLVIGAAFFAINNDPPLLRAAGLGVVGAMTSFVAGWWMITWPDVGQLSANKGQRPRRIVRVTLAVILAVVAVEALIPFLSLGIRPDIRILLLLPVMPAMGVGFWAGMLYIRWLAPRIPDGRAYQQSRRLLTLVAWIIGAYGVAIGMAFLYELLHVRSPPCLGSLFALAINGAGLVALIMFCRLFVLLRRSLLRVADAQARRA